MLSFFKCKTPLDRRRGFTTYKMRLDELLSIDHTATDPTTGVTGWLCGIIVNSRMYNNCATDDVCLIIPTNSPAIGANRNTSISLPIQGDIADIA